MDCSRCDHYNHGLGLPLCLRCKKYKEIQLKSVKRDNIKTENLPQAVMDNIADPRTRDLMTIVRQLPAQYAVPLLMRSVLNMSIPDIAVFFKISKQAVDQKISKGIDIIKLSILHG